MTIKDRKEREREALKSKILFEAEKILANKGIENLSMRKIASEIEYSPTTIYRFFKDKESLLTAIIRRNQNEIKRRFQRILEDESLNALDTLKYLISEYIRFGLEFQDTYTLYTKLCSFEIVDGEIYEIIGGERYRIFSSWQDQIDILINEGRISGYGSIDIILLIWHVTHGYISNRISVKNFNWKDTDEEIGGLIDMIFNGILIK